MDLTKHHIICPICNRDFTISYMARHIGLKTDTPHAKWRLDHNFPARITLRTLSDYKIALCFTVLKEFPIKR